MKRRAIKLQTLLSLIQQEHRDYITKLIFEGYLRDYGFDFEIEEEETSNSNQQDGE